MKCDNCGNNNANIKYYRNINGVKKEMNLCEECGKKLGITDIGFNMPMDFSSFLGGFFDNLENDNLLSLMDVNEVNRCKGCNSTFEDIINTGKFGCPECYNTFETQIDSLMNKLQGSNRHIGRLGKVEKLQVNDDKDSKNNENDKLTQLKEKLKNLVKDEKYEEAAKVRDEIKEMEEK